MHFLGLFNPQFGLEPPYTKVAEAVVELDKPIDLGIVSINNVNVEVSVHSADAGDLKRFGYDPDVTPAGTGKKRWVEGAMWMRSGWGGDGVGVDQLWVGCGWVWMEVVRAKAGQGGSRRVEAGRG